LRRFLDSKRQDSDFGQGEPAESSD
jgi:hypothetical protein